MQRLSNFHLPELRVPSLQVRGLRRPRLDLDDPRRLAGPLQFFFYLLMFVALLAVLSGATGTGVAMLVVGAALHVVRSSLAEVAARRQVRRERDERKRQVRLRSHRIAQRAAQEAKPARPAPRRHPAVAQPGPSPARKQRVV
jgi:hypothetical protein